MEKLIKSSLIVLLLLCLAPMPYEYYESFRFLSLVGFSFLAYQCFQQNKKKKVIIYVFLMLLFQPLKKINLSSELWSIIDVIVAVGLLISLSKKEKK